MYVATVVHSSVLVLLELSTVLRKCLVRDSDEQETQKEDWLARADTKAKEVQRILHRGRCNRIGSNTEGHGEIAFTTLTILTPVAFRHVV